MHIVLLILKIIGAILGGLLGLLLLLVLLVLFVPVRYQVNLVVQGKVDSDSYISWLWHIVHISIQYHESKMNYCLRIFGIPVRKNKEQNIKEKKKNPKKGKKNKKEKTENRKQREIEQKTVGVPERKTETESKIITEQKSDTKLTVLQENKQDTSKEKVQLAIDNKPEKRKRTGFLNRLKGKDIFRKVKEFFQKMKNLFVKMKEKIKSIPFAWYKIKRKISKINQKKNRILTFLKDEGTKNTFRKIKKRGIEVLRYVGPKKLTGYIRFGTGDPCNTGKVLGILCVAKAYFKSKVVLKPDFDDKVLETNMTAWGRMRVIRFLRIGASLYFDKEIKKCIADGKQIKEELNG